MDLTSTSLGSKEALSCTNKAFMNYVTSRLHSGMGKKNKSRVDREMKEDFEYKKYLYRVTDIGSKPLFRFISGTHGSNLLGTIVKLESVEYVL